MDYRPRLKKLSICFALLGILILATLTDRMIHQGDELTHRSYLDQPMLDLIHQLAKEGIITPDGDTVKIDMTRLRTRVRNPATRRYIVDRRQYMGFTGNSLDLDPAAVRVTNRRIIHQAGKLARGRILDRNGKVLAKTVRTPSGRTIRQYPLGPATMPLLGLAHPVYGMKGLEQFLSPYLEGRTEEGLLNRLYRFFTGKVKYYDAVLTIDSRIQQKAFDLLAGKTGAVVVLNAKTGEILAAASTPSFDPATPSGRLWDQAARKGYKGPFVNRGFQRRYPPGSTFKVLVAAAWMEQEDFDITWGLRCKGRHPKYRIREYRGKAHGWVSLKTALTLSCNVFFAEIGVRLGSRLLDYAQRFGFNRQWVFFDNMPAGALITESHAFYGRPGTGRMEPWHPIDFKRNPKLAAQAGVGQNLIQATPLQMALIGAVLANGGELMAPRLIRHIRYGKKDAGDQTAWFKYKTSKPRKIRTVCKRETADAVLSMMAAVMKNGTGHRLKKIFRQDQEYKSGPTLPDGAKNLIVGKTGTAETARGMPDHSWFLAVAPLDEPRYSVAVIVEYGGLGGRTAGPIAVEVMLETLKSKD